MAAVVERAAKPAAVPEEVAVHLPQTGLPLLESAVAVVVALFAPPKWISRVQEEEGEIYPLLGMLEGPCSACSAPCHGLQHKGPSQILRQSGGQWPMQDHDK